jgi:hypothetical protein
MDVVIHQHHQDDGNQEFSKSLQGCEATNLKEKKIHNDKSTEFHWCPQSLFIRGLLNLSNV